MLLRASTTQKGAPLDQCRVGGIGVRLVVIDRDDLVKFTTVAHCEPRWVIFNKGDPGDCLYGILSGRVRIYSTSLALSAPALDDLGNRGCCLSRVSGAIGKPSSGLG